jgi:hypothetical protein
MELESLLSNYNGVEIFVILACVLIAIKEILELFDWYKNRVQKPFEIQNSLQEQNELRDKRLEDLEKNQILKNQNDKDMREELSILRQSDIDSLKVYLTDKHHFYVNSQKWIDDYNLDCLERRYIHYKSVGGNSFIDHLMEEVRRLPHGPQ